MRGQTRGTTVGEDDQRVVCIDNPLQETRATTGGQQIMNVTRRTTAGEKDQTAVGTDNPPWEATEMTDG